MSRFYRGIFLWALCMVFCVFLPVSARAQVRFLPKTSLVNVTEAKTIEGKWVKKGKHVRFYKTNGAYVKGNWLESEGNIFYADVNGDRVKGWVQYRGKLYFLGDRGILQTGWMKKDGKRYFLQEDGAAATGFLTMGKSSYYFNKSTAAAMSGWMRIGKYDYFFSYKTCRMMKKSWIETNGKYYYVNKDGRKRGQGWLKRGDKQYYLDASGARVTGRLTINGKGCYFDKNGVYDPSVKVEAEPDPSRPMVALTFDDGPGQYTGRLLDCLKKNDAKATFFMVGSMVPYYKSTVRRMADMGCELGNHSYDHTSLTSLSDAGISSQISRTSANIRSAAGRGPTLARLPYGNGHSDSRVLNALGLPSIYWSIDTMDWANTGDPSHTVNAVLNYVRDGDIVLMHDIHYSTVVAAERIIPELKRRGYQLVTVSQLAKYKGKTSLSCGRTYYHFR